MQDVFKEARSQDHVEAKNDMDTHIRSRKLPLTRKIYAFYHAPIVKFWSNTVWRLVREVYTICVCVHSTMILFLVVGKWGHKGKGVLLQS